MSVRVLGFLGVDVASRAYWQVPANARSPAGDCNIGAYFSGIASFSPHGWIWGVVALGALG